MSAPAVQPREVGPDSPPAEKWDAIVAVMVGFWADEKLAELESHAAETADHAECVGALRRLVDEAAARAGRGLDLPSLLDIARQSPRTEKTSCAYGCGWTVDVAVHEVPALGRAHARECPESPMRKVSNALRAVLPLARSRAEDLHDMGGDDSPEWQAADKAVSEAEALLASLEAA